jgi:hypothetical protein
MRLVVFLSMSLFAITPAAKAAQYCGERLEGGAVMRATEAEARKDAENWWISRAGSLGKGFQDWNMAQDKKVDCAPKANGSVRCTASAKPCLPEGTLPSDIPKVEM